MDENPEGSTLGDSRRQPALDPRVGMAAERTLLAWIRTGLALMGFGFVVARFGLFLRELAAAQNQTPPHSTGLSYWVGGTLLILGVVITVLATLQHIHVVKRLSAGEPYRVKILSLGVILGLLLGVIGVVMTAYLMLSLR